MSAGRVPAASIGWVRPMSFIYEWEWDAGHHPLPLTPAFGSVYPRWMEEALRVTFAEFGLLAQGIDMRLRRGYPFTRVRPVGLAAFPPAALVRPALRLWWLHPIVSRRARTAVRRMRTDHSGELLRRWERRWQATIIAEQQRLRDVALELLTDQELAEHISRLMDQTRRWVIVHFLLHGAISIPLMRLDRYLRETPELRGVRLEDLIRGSSHATSAPAAALAEVAATFRDDPKLVDEAAMLAPAEGLSLLQERSPAFAASFASYLKQFGQGIIGRYEFIVPTLAEQPASLLPALLAMARSGAGAGEGDQAGVAAAEETTLRLHRAAEERRFRDLVDAARRAYAVRDENVQITFVDAFGLGRRALLEAGRRLAVRKAIGERDDVFFLTVGETIGALGGRSHPAANVIRRRRDAWDVARRNPPAAGLGRRIAMTGFEGLPPEAAEANRALIGYMGEIMAAPRVEVEPSASELLLRGIGAVRGRYTGTARVLRGEEDFDRLSPGEVLVCAITSPAWAPVLPLVGALVTDHGGILSHPAVIAREFGIPAVVATRRATALIPDGALVEVDGERGVVRVLEAAGGDRVG